MKNKNLTRLNIKNIISKEREMERRDTKIMGMRFVKRFTLQAIGDKFNLTREAVRQIIEKRVDKFDLFRYNKIKDLTK